MPVTMKSGSPAKTSPSLKKPPSGSPKVIGKGDVKKSPTLALMGKINKGIVSKTVTDKDGKHTTEEEFPLGEELVQEPHATVGLSVGLTRKMADFENIKFQVSVFLPSAINVTALDETYLRAKEWIDGKVNEINEEVSEMLGDD